jgi:hypothetical protein
MNTTASYSGLVSANNKHIRCGLSARIISARACICPTCEGGKECIHVTWSREKLNVIGTIVKRHSYMNVPFDHVRINYSDHPEDYIVFPIDQIEVL